jgi:PIN domain nuclease of toxin-antitoxin system
MRLLIDTHILVWIVRDDKRLTDDMRAALADVDNGIFVSPVVAYELTYLQQCARIPLREPIDRLQQLVGFELVDLPADIWRIVTELPLIHRDPVDRMLVAHALAADMTLVTADRSIRRYPVPTI